MIRRVDTLKSHMILKLEKSVKNPRQVYLQSCINTLGHEAFLAIFCNIRVAIGFGKSKIV